MGARKNIDWDHQPLGEISDYELAQKLGCSAVAVCAARKARGIAPLQRHRARCDPAPFLSQLGTVPDRAIAADHGITEAQVSYARRRRGVAPHRNNWDEQPLGTVPDVVLAERLGVDNKVVAEARWRRGISKWQEGRRCPCGEGFIAVHRRQRYCCSRCQRDHWHWRKKHGLTVRLADCKIALAAYKRTMKGRG